MFESQYYRLYKDYSGPFPAVAAPPQTALTVGHPYRIEVNEPLTFHEAFPKRRKKEHHVMADFLFGQPGTLVSRSAAKVLKRTATTGFQVVPAMFRDAFGETHSDYWYLHPSHTENLIDLQRSVRLPMPAGSMLTLDEIKFNTETLAAVPEKRRMVLKSWDVTNGGPFFHIRLITALLQAGLTGFAFRSVDRYRHGIESEERD